MSLISFSVICSPCSKSNANISKYCRTGSEIPEDVAGETGTINVSFFFNIQGRRKQKKGLFLFFYSYII